MAKQKFIFTGHRGLIEDVALENGAVFEADPEWISGQNFPACPFPAQGIVTEVETIEEKA